MKKLIILSTICIAIISCSVNEKPQFVGIDNIKVLESTSKYVTFTADALFINPTDSLFSNKSIGGLIGSLFSKKVKVQYIGDIKYKVLGFSYTYNIDKTEDVKIKF